MAVLYRKKKNSDLFASFEEETKLNVVGAQNYIPIYQRFFELNATNWQNVTLYHLRTLDSVSNKENDNIFSAKVTDGDEKESLVTVFFKYSPLLDPSKYLTGCYSLDEKLPSFSGNEGVNPKLLDVNNSAYIDSFFYYLSSRLKDKGFEHGIDFYGSYLGYKNGFKYCLEEDADCIAADTFFKKHVGGVFKTTMPVRGKLDKIELGEDCCLNDCVVITDETETRKVEATVEEEIVTSTNILSSSPNSQGSSNSSRSSNSSNSNNSNNTSRSSESDGNSYQMTEEFVSIEKYPVQIIAMEACENTLDSLLETMKAEELVSCLFQIIMMLIAYQKVYQFTHNDLHTNNVMYVRTDKPFLYYWVDNTAYKVPTFGKIFKIIDFGRSVYTFQNEKFISDSFNVNGDAATQYNTEPFFNPLKARVEPNYSFDLCRLACSMIDIMPESEEYEDVNQLLDDWCSDDKGRNVVYKKNGEERYPGFKLYKMIARTVHRNVPLAQLRRPIFQTFIIKKKMLKKVECMDIDAL